MLDRLRRPNENDEWSRFVELYTPLLYSWVIKSGVRDQDAGDLVQEVLARVVRKLPEYHYDHNGSFRGWMLTIALNVHRDQRRRSNARPAEFAVATLEPAAESDAALEFEEEEYRRYLVTRALQIMKADFRPTTWQACWEHVVSDRSAAEVAQELGISEGAVFAAKSRVLRRLRHELQGLLD